MVMARTSSFGRSIRQSDHNYNLRSVTVPTRIFANLSARKLSTILTKSRKNKIEEFKNQNPEEIGTPKWILDLLIYMNDTPVRVHDVKRWLKKHSWISEPSYQRTILRQYDDGMPFLTPQTNFDEHVALDLSSHRSLRPIRTSTPIQGPSKQSKSQQNRSSHPNSMLLSPDINHRENANQQQRNFVETYNPNPNDTVPLRIEIVCENNADQQESPVPNQVREHYERLEREREEEQNQDQDPMDTHEQVQENPVAQNQTPQYPYIQASSSNQIPSVNLLYSQPPQPQCICPQCRPANPYPYPRIESYYSLNHQQPYQYQYQPVPIVPMADSSSNGFPSFPNMSNPNLYNQIPNPNTNQPQPQQNDGQGTSQSSESQPSSRGTATAYPVEGPVTHFTKSIKLFNIIARHFEKEIKTRALLISIGDMYTRLTRAYKSEIIPSHAKALLAFTTKVKTERFARAQEQYEANQREREELDKIPDRYNEEGELITTSAPHEAGEDSDIIYVENDSSWSD